LAETSRIDSFLWRKAERRLLRAVREAVVFWVKTALNTASLQMLSGFGKSITFIIASVQILHGDAWRFEIPEYFVIRAEGFNTFCTLPRGKFIALYKLTGRFQTLN